MTADSRTNRVRSLILFLSKIEGLPIALVLVAVFAVFIITAPTVFLKPGIYMSFFETVPPMVICGLGLTLVITAGEIDLSFPAVVALSGLALAWSYRNLDPVWGPWVGVVLALAAGALVGYINGLMVASARRSVDHGDSGSAVVLVRHHDPGGRASGRARWNSRPFPA
ncbi:MAG: hypothetical protein U0703_14080 [Anaerolineae bacterium]